MSSYLISIAIVIRVVVGLWGYSGRNNPPMFGDFEAQRHWLEITVNTPIGEWYKNTTENDLLYWGLDYPPLTAYVSFVFGSLAQVVHPELVELRLSRGHDSENGKLFMRMSVLILDVFIFFLAIKKFATLLHQRGLSIEGVSKRPNNISSLPLDLQTFIPLMSPALILIDHGHFQYNCVCIGLAVLGMRYIVRGRHMLGSLLFCLSLNFKQMALYYAPVFFFSLLRKCFEQYRSAGLVGGIQKLVSIGSVVVLTFVILWLPFCVFPGPEETCLSSLFQVLTRLFPFSRGIFEDKVANFWYSLSVLIDFRNFLDAQLLVRLSTCLTLLLISPVAFDLLLHPLTAERAALALLNSSIAFFLASFQVLQNITYIFMYCKFNQFLVYKLSQVHEKSLLLVLVPASLLFVSDPLVMSWFQLLGVFSMYPLLLKDGLKVPYALCVVIFITISRLSEDKVQRIDPKLEKKGVNKTYFQFFRRLFLTLSYTGAFAMKLSCYFYSAVAI
jgi:alpha-1,3-glucosyltransferase